MSMPAETNEDMPAVDVRSLLPEGSEDPLQSDAYFLRIYLAKSTFSSTPSSKLMCLLMTKAYDSASFG